MRLRTPSILALAGSLAVGVVIGAGPAAAADSIAVADLMASITVAPENTSPYSRDYFQHWIDADGNGCDTRAEVLIAESEVPTGPGCPTIRTGQWRSYYDGAVWTLASDVDIDHMIPLSEAWDSGAQLWTPEQRRDFANDLGYAASLVAVTDNVNQSKGDRDPAELTRPPAEWTGNLAEWMPPAPEATCRYIGDWVAVKYRWSLSVDQTEADVINGLLSGSCAGATVERPAKADGSTPPPPPPPPADNAVIEAYVTKVYADLFGRAPDPTGLAAWTAALASGTPYGEVANGITYSDEYRSRLIAASYETYLGRGPDPSGAAGWLAAMRSGATIQQMEAGFIASDEYYAKAGSTDAGWVAELYRHVLGREAAPSEIQSWTVALAQGGTRHQVAMGFLVSYEHLTDVVDGHYQHLLSRGIDPEGAHSWVIAIQGGVRVEAVIAGIVASNEYRSNP